MGLVLFYIIYIGAENAILNQVFTLFPEIPVIILRYAQTTMWKNANLPVDCPSSLLSSAILIY